MFEDESVAFLNRETLKFTGLKPGKTYVTVTYGNFSYTFSVYVFENEADYYEERREVALFTESIITDYTVSLSNNTQKQIRGVLYYSHGTFEEISNAEYSVGLWCGQRWGI